MSAGAAFGAVADYSVGQVFSQEAAGDEREFNKQMAQDNRAWQERMSNSAYQRSKQDLIKAGLNPSLAYGNGPASTPGGSTASAGAGSQPSSKLGESLQFAAKNNLDKQLTGETIKTQKAQQLVLAADALQKGESAAKTSIEKQGLEAMLQSVISRGKNDLEYENMRKETLKYDFWNDRAFKFLGTLNSGKDLVNPFGKLDGIFDRLPKNLGRSGKDVYYKNGPKQGQILE